MKTRNFLWGAMGLLAMASCSNDELVSVNHDGDEIAFNVVTNANTRVATGENGTGGVYCNINRPEKFYVWATTEDGKTYIDGDEIKEVSRTTTSEIGRMLITTHAYKNQSNTRYWPEGKLHFYAFGNEEKDEVIGDGHYRFDWNSGAPTIDVTVPTDVYQQKDLLYAVKKDQTKELPTAEGKGIGSGSGIGVGPIKRYNYVSLNFRHALSQIVFTAQNMSPKLYVEIKGVSICKVNSHGTFSYPDQNTENNIDGHPTGGLLGGSEEPTVPPVLPEPNYTDGSWGSWGELSEPKTYSVSFDPVSVPGNVDPNTDPTSLTNTKYVYDKTLYPEGKEPVTTEITAEYSRDAMLLLPQTTTAWIPTEGVLPETQAGTYFLVKCRIFNIGGDEFNETTDVCLWGNKEENGTYTAKNIAMPVKLEWTQGKKYIYNFMFGTSGSAVDPEHPENPVLVPIDFAVMSVDDFVPADPVDVPEAIEDAESSIRDTETVS